MTTKRVTKDFAPYFDGRMDALTAALAGAYGRMIAYCCDYCGEPIADDDRFVTVSARGVADDEDRAIGWRQVDGWIGHYHADVERPCYDHVLDAIDLVRASAQTLAAIPTAERNVKAREGSVMDDLDAFAERLDDRLATIYDHLLAVQGDSDALTDTIETIELYDLRLLLFGVVRGALPRRTGGDS